ncbi:DUF7502 family protein [Salinirubrum litoreum]|uniref:Uncharacterized protein n=1 Tax=Salinirubrum litoreum TaxID=1126234 RepID=A0ABD5R7F1_9EURY|nr:hypothetical protein [Salinirubrum litoreum]
MPETKSDSQRVREAIEEVRREGYKLAAVYAVIDAAAVALVVNLLLTVLALDALPAEVSVPGVLVGLAERVAGRQFGPVRIATSTVIGAGLGLVVGVGEFVYRARRPAVELFERANPEVREALRTARDAVEDGAESAMAVRLYRDVLTRLKQTSSVGLLDGKRLAIPMVLLLLASVLTVQVAVVDLQLGGGGVTGGGGGGVDDEFGGLQDGSEVLGDPEDVSAGDTEQNVSVGSSGAGSNEGGESPASYDDGGFAGDRAVESQQAGFAPDEEIEDADLIREYNLAIREEDDEE